MTFINMLQLFFSLRLIGFIEYNFENTYIREPKINFVTANAELYLIVYFGGITFLILSLTKRSTDIEENVWLAIIRSSIKIWYELKN